MSDLTTQEGSSTGSKTPAARSSDREFTIQLGDGLLPASIGNTKKCKCIIVETAEELERLVPSTAFAVLILGGHLDYPKKEE
ncbi:hypothetical protein M434DRAFT_34023 [Hypoxylon sp. CO27-5]|nr:hypothetical protein M434DRAFT_34023 [Hypoxylon sp. CO27-5]